MLGFLERHVRNPKALYAIAFSVTAMSAALAQTPSHGELAAAIRSAGLPCAHVTGFSASGDNAWLVQCNSGSFLVRKTQTGEYSVSASQ